MTAAVLFGAGSGALHAVTGPDHVLSLGPAAIRAPGHALRTGLLWGLGHGAGTLVLALPLLLLAQEGMLASLAGVGDRLAGAALLLLAGWTAWSMRRARVADAPAAHEDRAPSVVGFVHGATGAGGLALLLPVLVSGDAVRTTLFLIAFAVGSTVAMGALTTALGRAGQRLSPRSIGRAQLGLLAGAALLGVYKIAGL